jgi:hypothetical protein
MSKKKNANIVEPRRFDSSALDRETIVKDNLADVGREQMEQELREHNAVSPVLSGGDTDAAWQEAESTGEESVGGHAATPDQDIVDEIGRATGLEFQDHQELRTHDEVLAKRDRRRWELDRRSAGRDSI